MPTPGNVGTSWTWLRATASMTYTLMVRSGEMSKKNREVGWKIESWEIVGGNVLLLLLLLLLLLKICWIDCVDISIHLLLTVDGQLFLLGLSFGTREIKETGAFWAGGHGSQHLKDLQELMGWRNRWCNQPTLGFVFASLLSKHLGFFIWSGASCLSVLLLAYNELTKHSFQMVFLFIS